MCCVVEVAFAEKLSIFLTLLSPFLLVMIRGVACVFCFSYIRAYGRLSNALHSIHPRWTLTEAFDSISATRSISQPRRLLLISSMPIASFHTRVVQVLFGSEKAAGGSHLWMKCCTSHASTLPMDTTKVIYRLGEWAFISDHCYLASACSYESIMRA